MAKIMQGIDSIIIGAGIWGCTLARRLAEIGRRVLVLEARAVVGGNVRCEMDAATGIEVHKYGSHIFHTHIPEVWEFVNRFVKFNGYQHKVLAQYRGRTYFLPLGLVLINKFFGVELKPGEVAAFLGEGGHAAALYDAFFRGYSSKQWGMPLEQLDASIIRRVPVRNNYNVNYYDDCWQGIPVEGYNALFARLLDHPNIMVQCNTEFTLESELGRKALAESIPIYYSGPVDRLFGYKYGALSWRSLRFESETLNLADFQGTSVVNYTEESVPYTRIHEFKHYHPELKDVMSLEKTIIAREYPKTWELGDEPYYPMRNQASEKLLARYQNEARKYPNLILGGRLGSYQYFDMDQAMKAALDIRL